MSTTLCYDGSNFISDGNRMGNFVGKSDIFQNLRFSCRKSQILLKYRYIEIKRFGQGCDIQRIATKFGSISEPEFAINHTWVKIHVSNGYHKRFYKMVCQSPIQMSRPQKSILKLTCRSAQIIFRKLYLGLS